ncbi:hypothetical protein Cob_v012556 [Colletotrichum orbiculare MAFF 240422]|uniref:Uncharacterized protein n=1 Tax=Colletotrichum orbiculare (strain 104-T / ATCC 96160 / CBS 514.97 / LARS 414 / MAFF 240422) TaxID=1213857 RepID=N4VJX3_COLOR|nr:hypothetical protein Cob_v012556 [Colletotrichum orbiculare MAFF 240422]
MRPVLSLVLHHIVTPASIPTGCIPGSDDDDDDDNNDNDNDNNNDNKETIAVTSPKFDSTTTGPIITYIDENGSNRRTRPTRPRDPPHPPPPPPPGPDPLSHPSTGK